MFYILYKTINLANGRYYIGIHKTKILEDGYLGSGFVLIDAIKKYGKEKFKREILKIFDNEEEMILAEKEIVTPEFCKDPQTYNICEGGGYPPIRYGIFHASWGIKRPDASKRMKENNPSNLEHVKAKNKGTIAVIDLKTGKRFRTLKTDPRYLSGEVVHVNKGKITVRDNQGKIFRCSVNDPKYISGEYINNSIGRIRTKEHIEKIRNAVKGRKWSKEERLKRSLNKDKKPYKLIKCPHCNKEFPSNIVKRWHFDNCKEKL